MHLPVAIVDGKQVFRPTSLSYLTFFPGKALEPCQYPTIVDTWIEMQKLLEIDGGKVRSIGVSNFTVKTLTTLLSDPRVTVVPAVNQVEMHPYFPQMDLKDFCLERGIVLTAYSPLGAFSMPQAKMTLLRCVYVISRTTSSRRAQS